MLLRLVRHCLRAVIVYVTEGSVFQVARHRCRRATSGAEYEPGACNIRPATPQLGLVADHCAAAQLAAVGMVVEHSEDTAAAADSRRWSGKVKAVTGTIMRNSLNAAALYVLPARLDQGVFGHQFLDSFGFRVHTSRRVYLIWSIIISLDYATDRLEWD